MSRIVASYDMYLSMRTVTLLSKVTVFPPVVCGRLCISTGNMWDLQFPHIFGCYVEGALWFWWTLVYYFIMSSNQRLKKILTLKKCIVVNFTLKSVVHCRFLFVYNTRVGLRFIFVLHIIGGCSLTYRKDYSVCVFDYSVSNMVCLENRSVMVSMLLYFWTFILTIVLINQT